MRLVIYFQTTQHAVMRLVAEAIRSSMSQVGRQMLLLCVCLIGGHTWYLRLDICRWYIFKPNLQSFDWIQNLHLCTFHTLKCLYSMGNPSMIRAHQNQRYWPAFVFVKRWFWAVEKPPVLSHMKSKITVVVSKSLDEVNSHWLGLCKNLVYFGSGVCNCWAEILAD